MNLRSNENYFTVFGGYFNSTSQVKCCVTVCSWRISTGTESAKEATKWTFKCCCFVKRCFQSQEWFPSGRFDALEGRNMDEWGAPELHLPVKMVWRDQRLKNSNWILKSDCSTSWILVLWKERLVCIVVLKFFLLSLCFELLVSNFKKSDSCTHLSPLHCFIIHCFFLGGG